MTYTECLFHVAEIEETMNTGSTHRPSSSVEQDDGSIASSGGAMSLQGQSSLKITDSLDFELGWMRHFPAVETELPQKSLSEL
jgi:hypothetical protein